MNVLRKGMSVKIIEPLTLPSEYERMNMRRAHQVLVLGAAGKTGSRVAERLSTHGVSVRTAARSGADVHFDWDNQATSDRVLRGATGDPRQRKRRQAKRRRPRGNRHGTGHLRRVRRPGRPRLEIAEGTAPSS
jgi:hypothetical protein